MFGENILVKILPLQNEISLITIKNTNNDFLTGEIVEVGNGYKSFSHQFIMDKFTIGQHIMAQHHCVKPIEIDGKKYGIIKATDVLLVLGDTNE